MRPTGSGAKILQSFPVCVKCIRIMKSVTFIIRAFDVTVLEIISSNEVTPAKRFANSNYMKQMNADDLRILLCCAYKPPCRPVSRLLIQRRIMLILMAGDFNVDFHGNSRCPTSKLRNQREYQKQ